MSETHKTLYAKMARVMGALDRVQKDARNTHFNYMYVSDNAVYTACREQLAAENIAVFASMTSVQRDGKNTLAEFDFTLACGDSGETMTCHWYAEAQDAQDKGVNKAATAALKYWLLKTFIIPTGDDPDDAPGGATSKQQPKTTPEPPTTSELDTHFGPAQPWHADAARIVKLVDWAHGLWQGEPNMTRAHAINRVAKALRVEPTKPGDFNELVRAIQAQYGGTSTEAKEAIEAYGNDEQPTLPGTPKPVRKYSQTAAERSGIAAGQ